MKPKIIYFITGASGVGKTTLLSLLRNKHGEDPNWRFLHFDSIGVPSAEEMNREFRSGAKWQEAMTRKWIDLIFSASKPQEAVVLEGQVNMKYILDAFSARSRTQYIILHLDCSEEVMCSRLIQRNQPHLANYEMKNWLNFLRKQAEELGVWSLDTTSLSPEAVLAEFERKTFRN